MQKCKSGFSSSTSEELLFNSDEKLRHGSGYSKTKSSAGKVPWLNRLSDKFDCQLQLGKPFLHPATANTKLLMKKVWSPVPLWTELLLATWCLDSPSSWCFCWNSCKNRPAMTKILSSYFQYPSESWTVSSGLTKNYYKTQSKGNYHYTCHCC